jgi:hypothetical protein
MRADEKDIVTSLQSVSTSLIELSLNESLGSGEE